MTKTASPRMRMALEKSTPTFIRRETRCGPDGRRADQTTPLISFSLPSPPFFCRGGTITLCGHTTALPNHAEAVTPRHPREPPNRAPVRAGRCPRTPRRPAVTRQGAPMIPISTAWAHSALSRALLAWPWARSNAAAGSTPHAASKAPSVARSPIGKPWPNSATKTRRENRRARRLQARAPPARRAGSAAGKARAA